MTERYSSPLADALADSQKIIDGVINEQARWSTADGQPPKFDGKEWVAAKRHLASPDGMGNVRPVEVWQMLGAKDESGEVPLRYAASTPQGTFSWPANATDLYQVRRGLGMPGGYEATAGPATDAALVVRALGALHEAHPYNPSTHHVVNVPQELGGHVIMRTVLQPKHQPQSPPAEKRRLGLFKRRH